jgi:hypothetical protein
VRLEVTEGVFNHVSGSRSGIAGVYQRHDSAAEKRAALNAWAAHVLAAVEGRTATPLKSRNAGAGRLIPVLDPSLPAGLVEFLKSVVFLLVIGLSSGLAR